MLTSRQPPYSPGWFPSIVASLRRKALKLYGLKCCACDFVPKTSNQIDVHHLDPIAEGVRKTTLEDLIPLYANCHRLEHSETPPLPIDAIKAWLWKSFSALKTSTDLRFQILKMKVFMNLRCQAISVHSCSIWTASEVLRLRFIWLCFKGLCLVAGEINGRLKHCG
jgi:hypothetical protein